MTNFFISSSTPKKNQLNKEVYQDLDQFYRSFFASIYNELNIAKYKPIRDAVGLVLRKFEKCDHPLDYAGKLVMYIQAHTVLNHVRLTGRQRKLLRRVADKTKKINLNFVYTGPITDAKQFLNI